MLKKLKTVGLDFVFYKNHRYNDEPLLYQFTSIINDSKNKEEIVGSGTSFNEQKAKIKAVCESLERYCLGEYNSNNFIYSSSFKLPHPKIDLSSVISFSSLQRENLKFKDFLFNEKSKFWWVRGYKIDKNGKENIYIPSQLIYVPYKYQHEKIIRLPISTGSALECNLDLAIYRGICEVIERDSFMLFYLGKIPPIEIDLGASGKKLIAIREYFERYNLNLRVFDITTDLRVPVYMAVLTDNTGHGPTISLGLKCSLLKLEAVMGAIEEAQQTRPWMREEFSKINESELNNIVNNSNMISTPRERGIYWYKLDQDKELGYWLNSKNISKKLVANKINKEKLLIDTLSLLDSKYKIYYVDITTPVVKKLGYSVVKVIIPQLHPLYLDESYPYLDTTRLKAFDNRFSGDIIDLFPHPFL